MPRAIISHVRIAAHFFPPHSMDSLKRAEVDLSLRKDAGFSSPEMRKSEMYVRPKRWAFEDAHAEIRKRLEGSVSFLGNPHDEEGELYPT